MPRAEHAPHPMFDDRILSVRTWQRNDPDGVRHMERRTPYACIDPGVAGAAVFVGDGIKHPQLEYRARCCVPFVDADSMRDMRRLMHSYGVQTLIIEDAYAGRNIKTAINSARWGGAVLALLAWALGDDRVDVVIVPPSSWQGAIFDVPASTEAYKEAAAKMAARDWKHDAVYTSANKARREGIADAWGLAVWWSRRPTLGR